MIIMLRVSSDKYLFNKIFLESFETHLIKNIKNYKTNKLFFYIKCSNSDPNLHTLEVFIHVKKSYSFASE